MPCGSQDRYQGTATMHDPIENIRDCEANEKQDMGILGIISEYTHTGGFFKYIVTKCFIQLKI